MIPIETVNFWFALGTIAMQITTLVLLGAYFLRTQFPDLEDIAAFMRRYGLWIAFVVSMGATLGSLYYSEVLGITPCGWCWVQRVFLYPQVLLFALALWKGDRGIANYSIALSIVGGIVALYQHYLQMGGTSALPCPATVTEALDCNVRFFFEFGYITFPLASFTLFAFLIVLMLFVRMRK